MKNPHNHRTGTHPALLPPGDEAGPGLDSFDSVEARLLLLLLLVVVKVVLLVLVLVLLLSLLLLLLLLAVDASTDVCALSSYSPSHPGTTLSRC